MPSPSINIKLPDWCAPFLARYGETFADDQSRMTLVLQLTELNIDHGGGPFGAAVFDDAGHLMSIGMNLVTLTNCSIAHAEMVALVLAEQTLHSYDLSLHGRQQWELVTSGEPCTMCLGAVIWSGVRRVVCAARDGDIRTMGFDEGPKPDDVTRELQQRGIEVQRDVMRAEAVALLQRYRDQGRPIYNAD